ncbi:hypothetical protein HRbin01_00232 [archaeon HR01]|nr:hypothetical protein HRbin01_00232 [archaeon HR01]
MGRRGRRSGLELGRVLRVSPGKLLVETKKVANLAAKVFNAEGGEVGYVSNVFGPENSPITVVKITSARIPVEGDILYLEERG